MGIDWREFESPFWRPAEGVWTSVVFSNWRTEQHQFKDNNAPKPLLVFDVLKIGEEEFTPGQRTYSTGSPSVVAKLRPYVELAEKKGVKAFAVSLLRQGKDTNIAPGGI